MDRVDRARRMRFYAARARMRRRDLANVLGVSEQTINAWISGRRFPPVETLSRFCAIVGTDLAGFYGPLPRTYRQKKTPELAKAG